MNNQIKKLISGALAIGITISTMPLAHAANYTYERKDTISDGLVLTNQSSKNTNGTGEKTYIYEYTPGGATTPIVAYGDKLYGKSDINDVIAYAERQGYTVMAGFNADFFSMNTGVPTGIVIREGRLCSSDGAWNAVGFKSDGTTIVGAPKLDMTFSVNGGQRFKISAFNKVRDGSGIFLYSGDYGSTTNLTSEGPSVVLEKMDNIDYLSFGGGITLKVVSAGNVTGATNLSDNRFVLTHQKALSAGIDLTALQAGDTVTIYTSSRSTQSWEDVYYACGAGDMMIENSAMTEAALKGTSKGPRTMIGIKNDGTVSVLVCDGRDGGTANGMSLKEAALALYDMGCKNVVNLDGGGSSIISTRYPGMADAKVISVPSDGSPRKSANFILFVNGGDSNSGGVNVSVYPKDPLVLAGGSIDLTAYEYNNDYYPLGKHTGSLTLDGGGELNGNTFIAPNYAGTTEVKSSAHGNTNKSSGTIITSVTSPETVNVVKKGSSSAISNLSIEPSETIDLDVIATDGLRNIVSSDEQFTFSLSGSIGTITESGVFTAIDLQGAVGQITVSFGDSVSRTINVAVGTAPEIICDFETTRGFTISKGSETTTAAANVQIVPDNARYGMGSLNMSYQTAENADEIAYSANTAIAFKSKVRQITLMAKGSGTWFVDFNTSSGVVTREITLAGGDWAFNIIDVPSGATSIAGFRAKAEANEQGNVYIDQIIGHYGTAQSDYQPPVIEEIYFGDMIELIIHDEGKYPLERANITVKIDGAKTDSFTFDEITGEFSLVPPLDGAIHRVSIEVRDYFGNLASYKVSTEGELTGPFGDIDGHWAKNSINYLTQKGVFTADTGFRPQDSATNEMVATIISRYMGIDTTKYSDVELPYIDGNKIHDWALPHVKALYALGVMQGGSDNEGNVWFYPTDAANRARVMTVLGRTISRGYNYSEATYSDFSAVPSWAQDHISLLSHLGVVQGYGGTSEVRANAGITRAEIATVLYRIY